MCKDCQNGYFSNGIDNESVVFYLQNPTKNQKSKQTLLLRLYFPPETELKDCACVFPGSMLEIKNQIDEIF